MWTSRFLTLARVGTPTTRPSLLFPSQNLGISPQTSFFFAQKKRICSSSSSSSSSGGEERQEEEKVEEDDKLYFTEEDSDDEGIPIQMKGVDLDDSAYQIDYFEEIGGGGGGGGGGRGIGGVVGGGGGGKGGVKGMSNGGEMNRGLSSFCSLSSPFFCRRYFSSALFLSSPVSSRPSFSSSTPAFDDNTLFSSDSDDEEEEEREREMEREREAFDSLPGTYEEKWEDGEVFDPTFEGGFGVQDTEIQSVIEDAFGSSDKSQSIANLEEELGQLERASSSLAVDAISQMTSPDQIFDTVQVPDKVDASIQGVLDNIDKKVAMGEVVVTPSDSPAARHIVDRIGLEDQPGKKKNKDRWMRIEDTITNIPSPSGPDFEKRPRLAVVEVNTPVWKDFGHLSPEEFFEGDSYHKFNEKNCTFLLRSQAEVKNFEGIKNTLAFMRERGGAPNRIHYSAALAGAAECKKYQFALELYNEMMDEGIIPSRAGYGAIIRCCFETKRPEEGLQFFRELEDTAGANVIIFTTIISGFVKLGDTTRAWDIYNYMLSEGHQPDQITYCTMINACTKDKAYEKALGIFNDMENEGLHPDQPTYHALLKVCARRHDCYDDMFRLYKSMVAAGFKGDERTLSHMLEGAARAADVRGAELIVSEMNKGRMKVTNTCLELLMRTYGRSIRYDLTEQKKENFDKGKKLYGLMKQKNDNKPHYKTDSSYLFLLCETGRLNTARELFDDMYGCPQSGNHPRIQDWNTLLKMYTRNKRVGFALQAYEDMEARMIEPDLSILERMVRQTARAGLIKKSMSFLSKMADRKMIPHKYALEPLVRKTKAYPDSWKEIKSELVRMGMSPGAIEMYFPPIKPMKRAPKELTKRSVRLRVEKHSAPKQGRKRKEAGLKEVIISRY